MKTGGDDREFMGQILCFVVPEATVLLVLGLV